MNCDNRITLVTATPFPFSHFIVYSDQLAIRQIMLLLKYILMNNLLSNLIPGETREEIVARLKRDLLPTLRNGLMYWPLCDFLTFRYIPVHLQVSFTASSPFFYSRKLEFLQAMQ